MYESVKCKHVMQWRNHHSDRTCPGHLPVNLHKCKCPREGALTITMTSHHKPQVIGYWMSDKKRQKLNWSEFGKVCRAQGFELKKLDLNIPLEEQGPFTLILHKLTDIIALANQQDETAQGMINRVETYLADHPEIAVMDPLPNVRQLLDRSKSYSIILGSDLGQIDVFTPTFVELTSSDVAENLQTLQSAGVQYPFVCKPLVGHGSSNAHKMALIFNDKGVADCKPPCVAQTFISHDAILYKIFMVGDEYFVVERPSLKNFYPCDEPTIFFDSHDVSKADSTSALSILDPEEVPSTLPKPEPARFSRVVQTLRRELGMALLGIDVVLEKGSNRYAIIDINAYPGYDGYPKFFESLMRCIKDTVKRHQHSLNKSKTTEASVMDPDDSGIDMGYSSDEKKKSLTAGRAQLLHKRTLMTNGLGSGTS